MSKGNPQNTSTHTHILDCVCACLGFTNAADIAHLHLPCLAASFLACLDLSVCPPAPSPANNKANGPSFRCRRWLRSQERATKKRRKTYCVASIASQHTHTHAGSTLAKISQHDNRRRRAESREWGKVVTSANSIWALGAAAAAETLLQPEVLFSLVSVTGCG